MPWRTVTNRRLVTFVPPEAAGIAGSFRSAASSVRGLAGDLNALRGSLDSSWQGNAKMAFMSKFNSMPGDLSSYASWLDSKAGEIESMTVSMWEEYEDREWYDDGEGTGY